MLYRKHIVSTRAILQLTVATMLFVSGVGSALAANSGVAPVLVPWTISLMGGNTAESGTGGGAPAGYQGDGFVAGNQTQFNSPKALAVDSVGNVYIADSNNAIIREINAQTGIISTVAGVPPKGCTTSNVNVAGGPGSSGGPTYGTSSTCAKVTSGCADGVPALNNPIGAAISGIAADAYGNIYFVDATQRAVSVVYRGGAQVASFITLEDPGGVASAGGVLPGYVYHVAGTINLATCAFTSGDADNALAFQGTSFEGPGASNVDPIALDSAGNIYIQDNTLGNVRVINTQATTQTFFEYAVQPGFMRTIIACNAAITVACPTLVTSSVGTGLSGPANQVAYNLDLNGMAVDQWGNVWEEDTKGCTICNVGVAFAGGATATNLINLSNISPVTPVTYGNFYKVSISGNVRATGAEVDNLGDFYYMDNRSPQSAVLEYINANSNIARELLAFAGQRSTTGSKTGFPATPFNPQYCIYGSPTVAFTSGPQTGDARADSCPSQLALSGSGNGNIIADGQGNMYYTDQTFARLLPLNNRFPSTPLATAAYAAPASLSAYNYTTYNYNSTVPVGTTTPTPSGALAVQALGIPVGQSVTQVLDVLFDGGSVPSSASFGTPNLPTQVGTFPNLTVPLTGATATFSIPSGAIPDFTINTTTPEIPEGFLQVAFGNGAVTGSAIQDTPGANTPGGTTLTLVPGVTCDALNSSSNDKSIDCLIAITFSPTQPGLRYSQLHVLTANGSQYNIPLSGYATGSQLAIDGGTATVVANPTATALGNTSAVAVSQSGTVYIADASNNRIVFENQTTSVNGAIGPAITVVSGYGVVPATSVSSNLVGPKGVAVDAAGNVYISDTGNQRVLEYNPITATATVLGGIMWTSCPATSSGTAPNITYTPTTAYQPLSTTLNVAQAYCPTYSAPGSTVTTATTFNSPQGLAVDFYGNVYVADTGNARIVEIPASQLLGGAVPLFQYAGAPTFVNPVAVAVDAHNNVYVADTGNPFQEVVEFPAGGGDLQTILPTGSHLPLIGGQNLTTPDGVAVDAAGNVYISDSAANLVWSIPAAGPPSGPPFPLNLYVPSSATPGLNAPAGLALDATGNLYIADSKNSRVLFENRNNPVVSFGTVPQDLTSPSGIAGLPLVNGQPCPVAGASTPCTGTLTVTNTGTSTIALTSPIATSPSPAPGYSSPIANTCPTSLGPGATCTISPTFKPTTDGSQAENVDINGTNEIAMVAGTGENPLANVVLSVNPTVPVLGTPAVVTATVTQPHVPGNTPAGSVTFSYTADAAIPSCATSGSSAAINLSGSGGTATAQYTLPTLLQGRTYVVSATYSGGDGVSSPTLATPLTFQIAGVPVIASATATPATYVYGGTVPTIAGTVTGITDSSVSYTFSSQADIQAQPAPPGIYPITVSFAGGTHCNYFVSQVNTSQSSSTAATITVTPASLQVTLPATFTTLYGAPDINFATSLVLGLVGGTSGVLPNGDINRISATFTPVDSGSPPALGQPILTVAGSPYPVVPTLTGKPISAGDYGTLAQIAANTSASQLIVLQAPSLVTVAAPSKSSTLPTTVSASTYSITPLTAVGGGGGQPTGSVTIYTTFTPIIAAAPGVGTTVLPCTIPFAATTLSPITSTVDVVSTFDLSIGMQVTSTAFPGGSTTITGFVEGTGLNPSTITFAAAPTVALNGAVLTAAPPASATCNAPFTAPLVNGTYTFIPTSSALGTYQFSFLYSGDSNFLPSTLSPASTTPACTPAAIATNCLLVDYSDFVLSSTTGIVPLLPGVVPSGNGLLAAPGQSSSSTQSAAIVVNSLQAETGVITLTCAPIGNPFSNPVVLPPAGAGTPASYIQCSMTPVQVTLTSGGNQTSVLGVSTPAQEPLGYNFFSEVRLPGSETMLAFLPLGVLAFCMRRRRRLSKVLWMLLAISLVTAGMTGCGGNTVALYAPVPEGPQYIQITATGVSASTATPADANGSTETRSFNVEIVID